MELRLASNQMQGDTPSTLKFHNQFFFYFLILILYVCEGLTCVSIYMPGTCRGPKMVGVLDPVELELKTVVSHCVVTGT